MHAKLSPSSAHRWSVCTAAPGEEAGLTDTSSDAARWGTACHLLASTCLEQGRTPDEFFGGHVVGGKHLAVDEKLGYTINALPGFDAEKITDAIAVDDELITCAWIYINFVRELRDTLGAELLVEQRVPIGWFTGEEGATGTADAVLIAGKELIVIDLKGGRGKVDAFVVDGDIARPNPQLAMYAAGALHAFDQFGEIETVRLVVVQPRLNHVSEHTMVVGQLHDFAAEMSAAAEATRSNPQYAPGDKACHWCKAKATCAAAREHAVGDLFAAEGGLSPDLGANYAKLSFIRNWCDAVEQTMRHELEKGNKSLGFKLVEGRMSPRAWKNADEAEKLLRDFRIAEKEMYAKSVVSPAAAEKLAEKGVIGPRQWKAMQEQIAPQTPGKPQIVPESSSKPSLADVNDLF